MTPRAPWRTLLVGFGDIAAALAHDPAKDTTYPYATHAQVLRDHPDFDWQAVVDPAKSARDNARNDWGISQAVPDIGALTDPDSFDIAIIATPPAFRQQVVDALPHLKAVLVEKPIAENTAAAHRLIESCAARDITLAVNLPRRADSHFRALADGHLTEQIGTLQAAFGVYGNGLANNATHLVDTIRMLLGDIVWVRAEPDSSGWTEGPLAGDTNLAFTLGLAAGPITMVQPISFQHYREVGLDLWGSTGRLSLLHEGLTEMFSPLAACRALTGAHEIRHDAPVFQTTSLGVSAYAVYDDLADALQTVRPPACTGEEALETHRVIEAILRSAAQGGKRETLTAS